MLDVQFLVRYNSCTGIPPARFDVVLSSRYISMQDHPSLSMSSSHPPDAETWKAYWREQGQPWRTEAVIDEERQQRRLSYPQGGVHNARGSYPVKGVRLSRADIEWLLAMDEQ